MAHDENGCYILTGTERKEVTKSRIDCGELVTTSYYLAGVLVRRDQVVNVDPKLMQEAFQIGTKTGGIG